MYYCAFIVGPISQKSTGMISPARIGDIASIPISGSGVYFSYVSMVATPVGAVFLVLEVAVLVWTALRYFDVITR